MSPGEIMISARSIGVDRAVDFGAIRRQTIISQIHPTAEEREQAKNRKIARETKDFDITKDFGKLGPKYGIWGFGLG